jgi:hypothetical protein
MALLRDELGGHVLRECRAKSVRNRGTALLTIYNAALRQRGRWVLGNIAPCKMGTGRGAPKKNLHSKKKGYKKTFLRCALWQGTPATRLSPAT